MKASEYNFVECGVADGLSAFFALKEIQGHKNFLMHLYDSWSEMKKEHLYDVESNYTGRYNTLNVESTKRNLSEFKNNLIYHQGYIPKSFKDLPKSPDSIVYLHIDLNSAKATLESLEFFYPRLIKGGVILFDDYGWVAYEETRKIVNDFFKDKPGALFALPTGQAIYYHI